MNAEKKSRNMDLEWENRILCSDESCIGTIGPDGRCRECGRPYEGTLPWVPGQDKTDEAPTIKGGQTDAVGDDRVREDDAANDAQSSEITAAPGDDGSADESPTASVDDEWERRTLCPDESCIGVIGPDGRCKECGRSV